MMRSRTGFVLVKGVKYKWYFGPDRNAIHTGDSELDSIPELSVECLESEYVSEDAGMALQMIPAALHDIKNSAWEKWASKQNGVTVE